MTPPEIIRSTCIHGWPKLAWIAYCPKGTKLRVFCWHGPGVENRDSWVSEAVWDGPFRQGNFDQTDLIFGSGIRLRTDGVHFVTSGSTVDRLHSIEVEGGVFVSNSFPCLLAALSPPTPDPSLLSGSPFRDIAKGIAEVDRTFNVGGGRIVRLHYFHNYVWDGRGLRRQEKPYADRSFRHYDDYVGFLRSSLSRIAKNAKDNNRRTKFNLLGTLSSGYDSNAASALTIEAGLTRAFTISEGRPPRGLLGDSGRVIGQRLGLKVHEFPRSIRTDKETDLLAILASGLDHELAVTAGRELAQNSVLVTGFMGSYWDYRPKRSSKYLRRGDTTGQSLTEWRLWVGAIHLPVPYLGARSCAYIAAISKAEYMRPWCVDGRYNKPIARRILEEVGIQRCSFGMTKKAIAIGSFESPLPKRLINRAKKWAFWKSHYWLRRGRLPPCINVPFRRYLLVDPISLAKILGHAMETVGFRGPWDKTRFALAIASIQRRALLKDVMFAYALERMIKYYRLEGPGAPTEKCGTTPADFERK